MVSSSTVQPAGKRKSQRDPWFQPTFPPIYSAVFSCGVLLRQTLVLRNY